MILQWLGVFATLLVSEKAPIKDGRLFSHFDCIAIGMVISKSLSMGFCHGIEIEFLILYVARNHNGSNCILATCRIDGYSLRSA